MAERNYKIAVIGGDGIGPEVVQAGQEPRRADVSVLIEPLADGEAEAPERDVVGKAWIGCRAEIDCVVAFELR